MIGACSDIRTMLKTAEIGSMVLGSCSLAARELNTFVGNRWHADLHKVRSSVSFHTLPMLPAPLTLIFQQFSARRVERRLRSYRSRGLACGCACNFSLNTITEVTTSCGVMLLFTSALGARDLAYQKTVRRCSSTCDFHTFDLGLIFTAPSIISRQLIVTVLPFGTTEMDTKYEEHLESHTFYKRTSLSTVISLDVYSVLKLSRPCCTYTQ